MNAKIEYVFYIRYITNFKMNLVKASSVLYPILGENVGDIILSYMIPNEQEYKKDRLYLCQFCVENGLNISYVDQLFEELKKMYDSNEWCKLKMEYDDCKLHGLECNFAGECSWNGELYRLICDSSVFPNWFSSNIDALKDDYRMQEEIQEDFEITELFKAFLLDLKLINEKEN